MVVLYLTSLYSTRFGNEECDLLNNLYSDPDSRIHYKRSWINLITHNASSDNAYGDSFYF